MPKNRLQPVWTSFLAVFFGLVRAVWVLGQPATGCGCQSVQIGLKNRTGPDLRTLEPNAQFSTQQSPSTANQSARMHGVPYREAIGSILWPVVVSQPDAAYAVGILSQFIQNLGQAHWEALKWVISYLGMTKNCWLTFGGKTQTLVEGFCDADWASQQHHHSISGLLFHFG